MRKRKESGLTSQALRPMNQVIPGPELKYSYQAPEALTRFLNLGIDVVNPVTLNPWFKLGAWAFFWLYCYTARWY